LTHKPDCIDAYGAGGCLSPEHRHRLRAEEELNVPSNSLMLFDRILLDKYKKDAGQLLCPFPVF
jgi:hypothetical protein